MNPSQSEIGIQLKIKVLSGPHATENFNFQKFPIMIGRGNENDIILTNDPKLSRYHIKVQLENNNIIVENLSSNNPIFYKDSFKQRIEIKPKESFKIGDTDLEFDWTQPLDEKTIVVGTATYAQMNSDSVSSSSVPTNLTPNEMPLNKSTPQNNKVLTGNKIDFKNSNISPKSNIPEVKYTPTMGGLANKNKGVTPSSTRPKQKKSQPKSMGFPLAPKGLLLIGVTIALAFYFIFGSADGPKKTRKISSLKDTDQINSELTQNTKRVEDYTKEKHLLADGRMENQFESAQSYYVKGFRDYRQGQYYRAIMSFQATLSFDPNHVLARKYLNMSIKKHSELVQFNLDQAKRYRQKSNYRLCRSAAKQVMTHRNDQNDSQYKDAKVIFDECDTLSKGRF